MTDGTPGAPSACWNCRQPLQAGSARCIWCGVPQGETAAPLVVAPPSGGTIGAAPAAARPATATPVAAAGELPSGFSGTVASTGARVVAFTVDIVLVVIAAGSAFALSRSAAIAIAVMLEVLLVMWILDARTGATPGKALLRLRTSRADHPASPGALPALGRALLPWADRLTRTVVVAVPPRPVLPQASAAPALPAPGVTPLVAPPLAAPDPAARPGLAPPPVAPASAVLAEPRVVNLTPPRSAVDDESESSAHTGAPALLGSVPQVAEIPAGGGPPVAEQADGSVLLVFDTGQRERFAAPVAINLGRNPAASQEGDRLVVVNDPESAVSKTHARLEHSRGSTWITDADSTNGTEIISDEGVVTVLAPRVPTLLEDGARVRLGKRVFTVSVVLGGDS